MSPRKRSPESTEDLRRRLIEHAARIVAEHGPDALTMRRLATAAGCAVGLPYKVFGDRRELVAEVVRGELRSLHAAFGELLERAGAGTVGGNLFWFADVLLQSPAVALTREVAADRELVASLVEDAREAEFEATALPTVIQRYLAGEKEHGRIAAHVDETAMGFLIAGAVHNLVMSGDAWPATTRKDLERVLAGAAASLAPPPAPDHE